MANKDEVVNGILKYIDDEVIPVLPTSGKWGLGTMVLLASEKSDEIFKTLTDNSIVKSLGVIDSQGDIDIDRLSIALKKSASKYGKLVLMVPIVGTLTFSEKDVDILYQYISGGK